MGNIRSSTRQRAGAGVVLITPEKDELKFAIRFQFKASNNEAEYEALLQGLKLAEKAGAKSIKVRTDSKLVNQQVRGQYEVKEDRMKTYAERIKYLGERFQKLQIEQIPRSDNQRADFLAKIGSSLLDCRERKITVMGVGLEEKVL